MALLEGKIALVTGGGSGVGKSASLLFASEGAEVVVAGRNIGNGQRTAREIADAGGKSVFVRTDVSKQEDIAALILAIQERYGRLDCAFNCAGYDGEKKSLTELEVDEWDKIVDTNLKGTFLLLKYEIRQMLVRKAGTIVNMASVSGILGRPGRCAYNASRSGIINLTKTSAVENIKNGIRINCISPGGIDTGIFRNMTGGDPDKRKDYENSHPIGRIARPGEIAEAALWLCSEKSSFVVGHNLVVDGGLTLI
jgi:NAD(P)-dependent dehydrogenase (short-subunit alcohol dehydrogenase family)